MNLSLEIPKVKWTPAQVEFLQNALARFQNFKHTSPAEHSNVPSLLVLCLRLIGHNFSEVDPSQFPLFLDEAKLDVLFRFCVEGIMQNRKLEKDQGNPDQNNPVLYFTYFIATIYIPKLDGMSMTWLEKNYVLGYDWTVKDLFDRIRYSIETSNFVNCTEATSKNMVIRILGPEKYLWGGDNGSGKLREYSVFQTGCALVVYSLEDILGIEIK